MKTKASISSFVIILAIVIFLLIPSLSIASDRDAGNYFVNVRPWNGETILFTPNSSDMPVKKTAEVTAKYDGKDHGFKFSCVSNSIYSSNYNPSNWVGNITSYTAKSQCLFMVNIRFQMTCQAFANATLYA